MEAISIILWLIVIVFHIRGIVLVFKHANKHQYNAKWIYITCGIAQIRIILALFGLSLD